MSSLETSQESMSRYVQLFIMGRMLRTAAPPSLMGMWLKLTVSSEVLSDCS
ncbi:hypothetical protein EVA_19357 [gut metagenome]|uniref:Uncharacterized protein n=1 Tax=gut metagenome TaxID=749906 RepID=J9FSM0_9ZZZZ